jgi:hypothetical protein
LAFQENASFLVFGESALLHRRESLCHRYFSISPFALFAFSPLAFFAKKGRLTYQLFKMRKIC